MIQTLLAIAGTDLNIKLVVEVVFLLSCIGLAAWFFMAVAKVPPPFSWMILGVLICAALYVMWYFIQRM